MSYYGVLCMRMSLNTIVRQTVYQLYSIQIFTTYTYNVYLVLVYMFLDYDTIYQVLFPHSSTTHGYVGSHPNIPSVDEILNPLSPNSWKRSFSMNVASFAFLLELQIVVDIAHNLINWISLSEQHQSTATLKLRTGTNIFEHSLASASLQATLLAMTGNKSFILGTKTLNSSGSNTKKSKSPRGYKKSRSSLKFSRATREFGSSTIKFSKPIIETRSENTKNDKELGNAKKY